MIVTRSIYGLVGSATPGAAQGYIAEAGKRSMGFLVQGIAVLVLFLGGLAWAVMSLL